MGPLPIVEVLPLVEVLRELRVIEFDCRPERLERGSLYPFDLAIQMRRARPARAEPDAPGPHGLLNVIGQEFLAAIGLDALVREGHLLGDTVEEGERAAGRLARIDAEPLVSGAVVDRCGLVEPLGDLADVHLHPIGRLQRLVPFYL